MSGRIGIEKYVTVSTVGVNSNKSIEGGHIC